MEAHPAYLGSGPMLRTAARVLASGRRNGIPPVYVYRALLLVLIDLAQALAELRAAQKRLLSGHCRQRGRYRLGTVAASAPNSVGDTQPRECHSSPQRDCGSPMKAILSPTR